MKKILVIDGLNCTSPKSIANEFTASLGLSRQWQGNLDALDDMLYGGFGTPEGGFVLVWNDSKRSEAALGPLFHKLVAIIKNHDDIELQLK
ncbi:MAG: barstar family protein [Planctomycetaceae bacterium]|nr:barstar family protein [Planctomycetaceae bacterium]